MVPTFLPLLEDMDPLHMHLVCLSVKTLQKLMDYSNSVVTLFRDLGGVDLLTIRLQTEVDRVIRSSHSATGDDGSMRIRECSHTTNTHQSANGVSLPATLVMIFQNVDKFGGDIYSSTVTVMCELIHKDPTCYPALDEAAICINAKGLEAVKETSALRFLVDVFTLKKYVLPMSDGIVPLANAFEELMRHVTSLKPTGVDLIIEIINKISTIEDSKSKGKGQFGEVNGSDVMDVDTEEKEKGVSDEQFIQLCIFHVMVLVHRTMENAENCRLFVELNGIEALLKLLLRPSITQSSEGMSIALHSTMVFKSFTQHHSASLARAFCSSLWDYLKTTLAGFKVVSGSFLLDPESTPDSRVFPSLFLVEFLLSLAASKDNKWVTALLQEFGNGSKDVLEDIGRVHREILWQIVLLEDAKIEIKDENVDGEESQPLETDEQRFNSFRQFLDPLMRRQMSGLSSESQFFDLINMYRDLTHSSGAGQRSHPTSQRSHPAGSSDMMRSLSSHITNLFQELGKAMLLPSRRRDDTVTVTPSSKSVASMIASISLDHLKFEDHVKSVASMSANCRYLGKVVEFIDGVLLDKPDSCNPIPLNCLYGVGVVQSVLTTFKATTELIFRTPMETDEGVLKQTDTEETVNGLLANYGRLMDHLVTSAFILSPSTKHLLTQPLVNGDILFPKDPEVFVKVLQSMILKVVLPLWTHPQFTDCNDDFVSTVISAIRHVFSGVEVKNSASRPSVPPNETTISMIVEMGFPRSRAEDALRQVGSNSVELATEWLFSHPEIVQEDDELAKALAMSLGNSSSVAVDTNQQQIEEVKRKLYIYLPLMTCCLLVKLCSGNDVMLLSLFHVLALLLNKDEDLREVASKSSLVKVASDLLSNWNSGIHENETLQVPKWVTAAFLCVDRLAQVDEKMNTDISELLKKEDVGNAMGIEEQKRLVEISCGYLKNQLPSETIHAVLQLCSTLTRSHSVAVGFLNVGGLPLLLSLPSGSLFVGFDNTAGSIIRHILEDPQTLQQAMESEIKQSVVTAASRQSNGRLTPRNFLMNLTSVISRDLVVFMQAAQSVCQIEMVGERPYVILLKDRDKDKSKEKEKEKEKEKTPVKIKIHRKPPQSFVNVIELLLASVITFTPPVKDDDSSLTDIDIDVALNKGKGKATSENNSQEYFASMAKAVFILKLLTEILLMYSPSVYVLLRRDNEVSSAQKGGVFHHILHQFLPYLKNNNNKEKKTDVDWRHKLAVKASQFLVASCVRSIEARKRIFVEINNVFVDFHNSSEVPQPPGQNIQAFVDLLNDVMAARSPTGSSISGEDSVTFIDVGLVKSLTQTLKVMDLDHVDLLKVAPVVVKVLEVVTKEHVNAAEGNYGKGDNAAKPPDHTEHEQTENENIASSVPTERIETYRGSEVVTDDMEHDQDIDGSFAPPNEDDYMHETSENNIRALENGFDYVGIRFEIQDDNQESNEDDDEDMLGDEGDEVDDDDDDDDDDDEDGEEDEDEDENNEDEEVHHLPHLDTDQDEHEHEVDEDDFDEDMIEEEEEDEDDDDDDDEDDDDGGVILGLGEEMNVLDQIEVFGRDHGLSNDALQVMPVEVFGSRRQGRTTSIYNLLRRTVGPSQHPLLLEPSSSHDGFADRNPESTSSRLESVFRSLRNGRHGHSHRLSMWAYNQQSGGTNSSVIPSGLEDLLVSQLSPPTPEKPPEVETNEPERTTDNNGVGDSIPPEDTGTENNESQRDICPSVEGVSQERSESGATLGESLQSLNVEIGSDDGGERQPRTNGNMTSLDSVTEVSENPIQKTEQQGDDARIDPAFLDALPDGLRAEVLSGRQGPVAQPVNTEPQNGNGNDNEIDPEFLTALPPDIRAEVLAQQQAQGAQRSHGLEGQPEEMDTVSIIATFPSETREEVLLTSSEAVLSNLTPALVAEANMLRERFVGRFNRTLFGMYPRSRRGEPSRRGEVAGSNGVATRRSTGTNIQTSATKTAPEFMCSC
ncbi:unnamed protein product [Lactuca saligna]|uniref:UBA domain-containing protein n=1 Tax=Lactuca saligna TaxID=75948 RepID=A0AA35ZGV1_LACSI|nr:unnamed protein product [Lactuca saligna]